MMVTLVPIYIAEVAPPAIRGLLVGQHGTYIDWQSVHDLVAACIC